MFTSNRLEAKGMNLCYVPRDERWKDCATRGSRVWNKHMEKVSGNVCCRWISIDRGYSEIPNGSRENNNQPEIYYKNYGYFLVKFASAEEQMFNNRLVIRKGWSPEFNFNEKRLNTIPLWIRLPNFPLSFWGNESWATQPSLVINIILVLLDYYYFSQLNVFIGSFT